MTDELLKKILEPLALAYKDAIRNHRLTNVEAIQRKRAGLSVYVSDYDKVIDITNETPSDYCYFIQPMMYDTYEAAKSELDLHKIINKEIDNRIANSFNEDYFKNFADYKDLAVGDVNVYYV